MRTRSFTLIAAWLLFRAVPASAQGSQPKYALSWVRGPGAGDCPTGHALARDVSERLGRMPFAMDAPNSIEIYLERTGDRYQSVVRVVSPENEIAGQRALESTDAGCTAIFQATALAVALLIDPEATTRSRTATGAPPRPAPPPGPAPAPQGPAPALPAPGPAPEMVAPPKPVVPMTRERPPPTAPSARVRATVSASGAAGIGVLPATAPGAALRVTLRPHRLIGVGADALYLSATEVTHPDVTLAVGLSALGVGVAFTLVERKPLFLSARAGLIAGSLNPSVRGRPEASGVTLRPPAELLFLALSAGLNAQVNVTEGFFFELSGVLLAPLGAHRFLVIGSEERTVWQEPAVGGVGLAGVGLGFF